MRLLHGLVRLAYRAGVLMRIASNKLCGIYVQPLTADLGESSFFCSFLYVCEWRRPAAPALHPPLLPLLLPVP